MKSYLNTIISINRIKDLKSRRPRASHYSINQRLKRQPVWAPVKIGKEDYFKQRRGTVSQLKKWVESVN